MLDAEKSRSKLVVKLLSQSDDYGDHWITFFNDLLRNDYSGTGFITGVTTDKQLALWALLESKPYHLMVRSKYMPPNDEGRALLMEFAGG